MLETKFCDFAELYMHIYIYTRRQNYFKTAVVTKKDIDNVFHCITPNPNFHFV